MSKGHHRSNETSLAQFDDTARAAAREVLKRYSTSFGAGARLLGPAMRRHIEAVYAMVRIADEIVDTYRGDDAAAVLNRCADEVHGAMERGYSPDVIAHAFALTARSVGITTRQTEPFFESMRMDLTVTVHDRDSFERYIYGSAAVVGEMCLAVFLYSGGEPEPLPEDLAAGARALGNAYQKINFLRDLALDSGQLGRQYFPGVTVDNLTNETVAELVADCRADIALARTCLPALPRRARIAVTTTIDIYARLLARIERIDASELCHTRVRVPNPVKLAIAVRHTTALGRGKHA